jgi:hypothetical protein
MLSLQARITRTWAANGQQSPLAARPIISKNCLQNCIFSFGAQGFANLTGDDLDRGGWLRDATCRVARDCNLEHDEVAL